MTTDTPEQGFPAILREFRLRHRLTQQQLADRLQIARNTLKAWEKGDPKRRPHILTVEGVEHRLARIDEEVLDHMC